MALITRESVSSLSMGEIDPLLKDLNEKKQSFRRNVVSLAAELKEVRSRLASQEQLFAHESLNRQAAEGKVKEMEEKTIKLKSSLEERNARLQLSASDTEKYLKGLDDLRSQFLTTQATLDASVASAQSAELQCLLLVEDLEKKNIPLIEQDVRIARLRDQLNNLESVIKERELSEKELKEKVLRIEHSISETVAKDGDLKKLVTEASSKYYGEMSDILTEKDEEIQKLRDEMATISAHWKLKTKDLESQVEEQRIADHEMKKKILKLEFCIHETRSHTRKLQRMGDRQEKAIKEMREELANSKQQQSDEKSKVEKHSFLESPGFNVLIPMSMLLLVLLSKR